MKYIKRLLKEKRDRELEEAEAEFLRAQKPGRPKKTKTQAPKKMYIPKNIVRAGLCRECGGINKICFGDEYCRNNNNFNTRCSIWHNGLYSVQILAALLPERIRTQGCICTSLPGDFTVGSREVLPSTLKAKN